MNIALRYLTLYILAFPHTSTQTGMEPSLRGTVVYVDVMKDEVVIAAGSRGTNPQNGSYRDNDCKILASKNDAIFASAGDRHLVTVVAGKSSTWDSQSVAKRAFNLGRRKPVKYVLAHFAATYWLEQGKKFFQAAFTADPSYVRKVLIDPTGGIAQGVFASRDETGRFSVFYGHIELGVNENKNTAVTGMVEPMEGQFGLAYPTIIQEFSPTPKSFRAQLETRKWAASLPKGLTSIQVREHKAAQLIRWSIEFRTVEGVGGDVNSVVLDKNGVRWPEQKNYCKIAE